MLGFVLVGQVLSHFAHICAERRIVSLHAFQDSHATMETALRASETRARLHRELGLLACENPLRREAIDRHVGIVRIAFGLFVNLRLGQFLISRSLNIWVPFSLGGLRGFVEASHRESTKAQIDQKESLLGAIPQIGHLLFLLLRSLPSIIFLHEPRTSASTLQFL